MDKEELLDNIYTSALIGALIGSIISMVILGIILIDVSKLL